MAGRVDPFNQASAARATSSVTLKRSHNTAIMVVLIFDREGVDMRQLVLLRFFFFANET